MKPAKQPKKRKHGESGAHVAKGFMLYEGRERQFSEWAAEAKKHGKTRNEWLREAGDEKLARGK